MNYKCYPTTVEITDLGFFIQGSAYIAQFLKFFDQYFILYFHKIVLQ